MLEIYPSSIARKCVSFAESDTSVKAVNLRTSNSKRDAGDQSVHFLPVDVAMTSRNPDEIELDRLNAFGARAGILLRHCEQY